MADETLKFVWIKMANHKHTYHDFDQAAIDSYLQGRMSPAEMHRFELTMLDDPFLADAVEGFKQANPSIAQQHLADIAALISGEAETEKKAAVIPLNRNYWWRVAAGIIVIASAGLITYKVLNQNQPIDEVAQLPTVSNPETTVDTAKNNQLITNTPEAIVDNRKIEKPSGDNTMAKEVIKKPVTPPDNQIAAVDDRKEKDQYAAKEDIANKETEAVKDLPKDATRGRSNDANVVTNNIFQNNDTNRPPIISGPTEPNARNYRGRVTRSNGDPVASALVKVDKSNTTVTDDNGNFDFNSKGDSAVVTVEGVGIAKSDAVIRQNASNTIVVKDADMSLSEVVVVGYATQKKKSITALTQQTEAVRGNLTNATPVGGLTAFNSYAKKAFAEKIDTTANPSAKVELQFLINKKGKPYRISVKQTSNPILNSAAIKVLQNGPTWQAGTNKKASVIISLQ
jgi:hypothetical protein